MADYGKLDETDITNLQNWGWEFIQYGPSEWGWHKFDGEGNCIAQQGDKTWENDIEMMHRDPL